MDIFDGVFVCFGLVFFILCLFQMHYGGAEFGVWWQGLEVGHILVEAVLSWHVECKWICQPWVVLLDSPSLQDLG